MKIKPIYAGVAAAVALSYPSAALSGDADINRYTQDQITSVSQFSDVRSTDWAYQALSNLVDRYGCVSGYPGGVFTGGRSLTRFEAAVLLNACLDRVTEVTDEIKRLQTEFSQELSVINRRVSDLEDQVDTIESQQFSTTTRLRGEATFTVGGVEDYETKAGDVANTAFNYDLRLNLDTSFTGSDLLRARLRSSNFSPDPFGSSNSLFSLERADGDDSFAIDRLYYQFPVLGDSATVVVGAQVRNSEMAWIPTAYNSDILTFFQTAGVPGVFNRATGTGLGVMWSEGSTGFVASANYVAENGQNSQEGLFDESSGINLLAQIGYRGQNWGLGLGYRYGTENTGIVTYNSLNGYPSVLGPGDRSNSYSVNGYWQPQQSGLLPSVSAGYGWSDISGSAGYVTDSDSWYVGLQWSDVLVDGNSAGVAVGQAPASEGLDKPTMLEIFYSYRVSDSVTITPALVYVSDNQRLNGDSSNWGGLIQTKFRF